MKEKKQSALLDNIESLAVGIIKGNEDRGQSSSISLDFSEEAEGLEDKDKKDGEGWRGKADNKELPLTYRLSGVDEVTANLILEITRRRAEGAVSNQKNGGKPIWINKDIYAYLERLKLVSNVSIEVIVENMLLHVLRQTGETIWKISQRKKRPSLD